VPDAVTYHYYVSLCFCGLKRLGFAGSESTNEDQSVARELAEMGGAFDFKPPLAGGPIFSLVYQIPGYLNPHDETEMLRIFDGVHQLIKTKSIEHFQREFPDRTIEWEKWFTGPWVNAICDHLQGKTQVCHLIDRFGEYMEGLWPKYSSEFCRWQDEFFLDQWNSQLSSEEVMDAWEHVLQTSYPYRNFSLVVCPETPSLASSLGPEKVVFGDRHGLKVAARSLVHEVGVRMIGLHRLARHEATSDIMAENLQAILRLIEAEICYRKPQVMDMLDLEYDSFDDRFLSGMQLEELVHMRSEICEKDSIPAHFARWYRRAKEAGLL